MTINSYHSSYRQRGGGIIKVYDGTYNQRGSGIGSFFRGVFNFLKPVGKFLKPIFSSPIVKDLGVDAVSTGLDVATEMMRGKKFKQAAKDNLKYAKKRVFKTIHEHTRPTNDSDSDPDNQQGGGVKMKIPQEAYSQPPPSKKRRKRRKTKKGLKKAFKKKRKVVRKTRKKGKRKISAKTIFH